MNSLEELLGESTGEGGGSTGGGTDGGTGDINGPAKSIASSNIIYYMKGIEGYAPYTYRDSVGVPTLGYGMTGKEIVGVSQPLPESTATNHLRDNCNSMYYKPLYDDMKKNGITPLQREIDAFVSFAYNNGVGGFLGSTLYRLYRQGIRDERIHNEFKRWVHAGGQVLPGLVRRREEEWRIFSNQGNVNGYFSRPFINYINKSGNPSSQLVSTNGGYGEKPY